MISADDDNPPEPWYEDDSSDEEEDECALPLGNEGIAFNTSSPYKRGEIFYMLMKDCRSGSFFLKSLMKSTYSN
jgi:hypothetical protein